MVRRMEEGLAFSRSSLDLNDLFVVLGLVCLFVLMVIEFRHVMSQIKLCIILMLIEIDLTYFWAPS